MKTLVNHSDKAIKIAVNMTGDIIVTLPGGEVVNGKLSNDELQQFAFRLTAMSEGKISFDPPASDLIAVHYSDIITLEKQSELLEQQREEILIHYEALSKERQTAGELQDRLTACEHDLVEARTNLKDSREAMSFMQEKIELYESAVSEREAVELKNSDSVELATDETVHNERSEPDSEPPSPPDSTVHNERSSVELYGAGSEANLLLPPEDEMPLL